MKKTQKFNKFPELAEAQKNFKEYFKVHGLDLSKDYTKDPVHGKAIRKLLKKLNFERDKVALKFPETDPNKMDLLRRLAKKQVEKELKIDLLQKHLRKEAKIKKEIIEKEKKPSKRKTLYEYPLVDGQEMTSSQKKAYRRRQRELKQIEDQPIKTNQSSADPTRASKLTKMEQKAKRMERSKEEKAKKHAKRIERLKEQAKTRIEED